MAPPTISRPVPYTSDPDTAGFWAAARQEQLAVQTCPQCRSVVHLPRPRCAQCGSEELEWTVVSGRGRLYSHTVVHHQIHPAFPAPYTVVLISLDDYPDVRYTGYVPGAPVLEAGMAMNVFFESLDGVSLPNWRPAS
jgi:uncharacterized OB-fold protein